MSEILALKRNFLAVCIFYAHTITKNWKTQKTATLHCNMRYFKHRNYPGCILHIVDDLRLSSVYDTDNIIAIFWEDGISHIARYKLYNSDLFVDKLSSTLCGKRRVTNFDITRKLENKATDDVANWTSRYVPSIRYAQDASLRMGLLHNVLVVQQFCKNDFSIINRKVIFATAYYETCSNLRVQIVNF